MCNILVLAVLFEAFIIYVLYRQVKHIRNNLKHEIARIEYFTKNETHQAKSLAMDCLEKMRMFESVFREEIADIQQELGTTGNTESIASTELILVRNEIEVYVSKVQDQVRTAQSSIESMYTTIQDLEEKILEVEFDIDKLEKQSMNLAGE